MNRTIKQTVLLLVLATFGTASSANTSEMTEQDYQILSAFFQTQSEDASAADKIRIGPTGSTLSPVTVAFSTALSPVARKAFIRKLPGLTADTLASFERCAATKYNVRYRFEVTTRYQIARSEEIADPKTFYSRHPGSAGYSQFSCVGTNASGTQAFFYVERLMTDVSFGEWVLMAKTGSGKWTIKQKKVCWSSKVAANAFSYNSSAVRERAHPPTGPE
jgi:hypothetical protein